MGCCGDREKDVVIKNDVKWEYVNLNDFKSSSCLTPLAYVYLWLMLIVSISVYAVDTFTAVNLIAFNRWAGQIKPAVPLEYTRWIFAGCIILSFLLLFYRWFRALRVMRGGKVAKSYLDPLAVRIDCIRMGQGRGWKRFLVFAELTKSRKGADYVALFTYYSFEAWLRIIFAEGPRTVINGITLVAYAQAHFVPVGEHAAPQGQSPFVQFWKNFGVLAEQDQLQMAIIIGMLWTCFIWILSALSLAASVILYLIFLWHHIPSDAGGLTKYCRSKINRRMERIVKQKTDKALKKENEIRAREEAKAFREGTAFKRQPTLPDVDGAANLPPTLSRQTTMSTLPEYTSRPGTAAPPDPMPSLPVIAPIDTQAHPPPGPRRHHTNASDSSWTSYNSNAPLMHQAAEVGYSPIDRMQTPSSGVPTPWSARPGQQARNFSEYTQYTDRSYTPSVGGPPRPGTSQTYRPNGDYPMAPLPRPGTGMSQRPGYQRQSSDSEMLPPIPRGMSPATVTQAPPFPDQRSRTPAQNNYNPYFPPVSPIPEYGGRDSPAIMADQPMRSHTPVGPPPRSFTPGHQPPLPRHQTPTPFGTDRYTPSPAPGPAQTPAPPSNGYVAFNPSVARTASPAPMTAPMPTSSPAPQTHTYQSYSTKSTTAANSQTWQAPGHVRQTSFSRPFPAQNGNGGLPISQNNLQPPRPGPPTRAGSFDDILDHY